jgi:hypothetical protein
MRHGTGRMRMRVDAMGRVIEEPLPAPDFKALDAAVDAAATPAAPKSNDVLDSAGHAIGNYL